MATNQSDKNRQNDLDIDIGPLEPGKSFRSLSDLMDHLVPDENLSYRRMNITTLSETYDNGLGQYAEPDEEFDICWFSGGINPSTVDLYDLDTEMNVAVVAEGDQIYLEQSFEDAETVSLSGTIHYVLPLDQEGEDYINSIR